VVKLEQGFKSLDVGCGSDFRGEVNLDHYKGENPEIDQSTNVFVNYRRIPNFVLGDALHLPFRDKSFQKVYCFHVIEHVPNPYRLINELVRVAIQTIEIRCPHRFSKWAKMPYHKNYFTMGWFVGIFNNYPRLKLRTKVTYWSPLRGMFSLIRFPDEIRIRVKLE